MEATQARMTNWKNFALTQTTFTVDQILPHSGILILGGETGIGKTFEGMHLASAIELGERWHGLQCNKQSCFYLLMEGSKQNARDKIDKVSNVRGADVMARWDIDTDFHLHTQAGLGNLFKMKGDAKVIFLDPVQAIIPNNWFDMAGFNLWYNGVRELQRQGITIIFVHNNRKHLYLRGATTDDDFNVDRLKAPSEFANRADSVVLYSIKKGNREGAWVEIARYLGVAKARSANKPLPHRQVTWSFEKACYNGTWDIFHRDEDVLANYLANAPENVRDEARAKGFLQD